MEDKKEQEELTIDEILVEIEKRNVGFYKRADDWAVKCMSYGIMLGYLIGSIIIAGLMFAVKLVHTVLSLTSLSDEAQYIIGLIVSLLLGILAGSVAFRIIKKWSEEARVFMPSYEAVKEKSKRKEK